MFDPDDLTNYTKNVLDDVSAIQDWKKVETWGEDGRDFGEEVVEDGKYALKHAGEKLVEEGKEEYEKDIKTLMLAMLKIDPLGKYGKNKVEGAEDFYNDELGDEYQGILSEVGFKIS